MVHTQGKPTPPPLKKAIVSVKEYFDRNRSEMKMEEPSDQMTADALGVGVATVRRIMADYHRSPESLKDPPALRGRPSFSVDTRYYEIVRKYIRQANKEGTYLTLKSIGDLLQKHSPEEDFNTSTLSRTLDRWGFSFGEGTRTMHLKEKDYIVAARRRYLRFMKANRTTNGSLKRPEVYLDESYINKNHSKDFTWYFGDDGPTIQKPTGKGDRLIILNAITSNGWVPSAKLVFKSSRKTGDYHGQMNAILFQKWFTEQLLPNIPSNSVIIMDNAAYHNTLTASSPPTKRCSKERIKSWLAKEGIPCSESSLKAELIEVLLQRAPTPIYEIDDIAQKSGHEVIRTPPYHPELQPIEVCWGIVKNHVAKNCDFTMKNLQLQLEAGFLKVSGDTCRKILAKIRKIENLYWSEDSKFDPSEELNL